MTVPFSINRRRLQLRLDKFAAIGGSPAGGVNRQALTRLDREARAALAQLAQARGFDVFQDSIANLFIRRAGRDNVRPPFLIGSHLDTQPTGGRFDGALGVLAGLEVLETLEDFGIQTECAVELVVWTNEEGCRFAPGSMGSQAYVVGALPADSLGADGASLSEELSATLLALPTAKMRALGGCPSGYLELHIEQGPILEREGFPVGVVTAVQGTRWLQVRIVGEAAHAGTTPLSARRDPMQATAAALSQLFATIMPADPDARLTVGRIMAEPGSINAIATDVTFTIDLRHPDADRLDEVEGEVTEVLHYAAKTYGCEVQLSRLFSLAPAKFDDTLMSCIERAVRDRGTTSTRLVSGAFHDALFVGRIAPAAMIFVPCRNGVSHNENEYVEPRFVEIGADILLHSMQNALSVLTFELPSAVVEPERENVQTA